MSELTTTNSTLSLFDTQNMQTLMNFADVMAKGQVSTPNHLRGKPADCLAITMQAAQWGMNPFAVAQKTHLVNGTLGYESQLINAVISSSRAIVGRFHYEQVGDWSKWQLNKKDSEIGLGVRVGAVLNGETEITWGETVWFSTVAIRNSPLWKTQPYQQICYLAMKHWARLYTPDVILGVYDKDELVQVEKDITPVKRSLTDMIKRKPKVEDSEPVLAATNNAEVAPSKFEQLKDLSNGISSTDDLNDLRKAFCEARDNGELTKEEVAGFVQVLNAKSGEVVS